MSDFRQMQHVRHDNQKTAPKQSGNQTWRLKNQLQYFSGGLMKFNGEIQENPLYTWKITKITTTGHKKSLHPENITHICLIYDHLGI